MKNSVSAGNCASNGGGSGGGFPWAGRGGRLAARGVAVIVSESPYPVG